jgi:hypothetical protein
MADAIWSKTAPLISLAVTGVVLQVMCWRRNPADTGVRPPIYAPSPFEPSAFSLQVSAFRFQLSAFSFQLSAFF